jgi:hypothetical protein
MKIHVFGGTGVWLQASHLEMRYSTSWATLPVHFALLILEIGSNELFAQLALNCDPPDLSLSHS